MVLAIMLSYVLTVAGLSFWFGYQVGEYRNEFHKRKDI